MGKAGDSKAPTDWEAIEREYRAGQLSVREIGRQYGVGAPAIVKRAQKGGWERNLSASVREAVNAKLVRETAAGNTEGNTFNARETVDAAAARGVELVRQHRATLARLNRIANGLLGSLEARLEAAAGERDPNDNAVTASFALIGEKETIADVMEKVQRTVAKVIPLERQAFNLDDKDAADGSVTIHFDRADSEA